MYLFYTIGKQTLLLCVQAKVLRYLKSPTLTVISQTYSPILAQMFICHVRRQTEVILSGLESRVWLCQPHLLQRRDLAGPVFCKIVSRLCQSIMGQHAGLVLSDCRIVFSKFQKVLRVLRGSSTNKLVYFSR